MSKKYDFSDFDEPASKYDFSDFEAAPEVSELEALGRGALQGASLGFSDEIMGAIEAALSEKTYEQARNESRANNRLAQDQNPWSYGTGEVGASIATALIPGLNVAKGASLATKVGANAAMGAAAGLGLSDEESAMELAKDAALGGALGGGLTYGLDKAAPYVKKGLDYVGEKAGQAEGKLVKKIGNSFFGVDEKATENYLKNPKAVNEAYSLGELADSVLNKADDSSVLNEMRSKVGKLSSSDWETLGRESRINKNDLLSIGEDFANTILKGKDGTLTRTQATGADADALKAIYRELDSIKAAYGDSLSEADLKSIIQSLQQKAFGSDTFSADKVKQLSGVFNEVLKGGNQKYADSVAKTQEATSALKQVKSVFENRTNPESYDKFNKQVKNLINKDDMSAANLAVNKIKEHTGYDLKKDIVDSWTQAQFEKGDVNGSRKTLLGGIVGSSAGSIAGPAGTLIGGVAGGVAGHVGDKYAGHIFKRLLDGRLSAQEFNKNLAPRLGKYAAPLSAAMQRGNAALASTVFILQQNDPTFRQLMKTEN